MRRGRVGTLAGSPTLVGAVTVLIVVVAVFLSYQANQGLPFVPTYKLSAELPNANTMVPGNEVRVGGTRVGQIKEIEPVQDPETGAVSARVDMELSQDLDPLPEDSTMIVRSRSALGLKYLEIQRGDSSEGFGAGETIPLSAARPEPVEIDQVFNTFDEPTRAAIQANLLEFGNALAGRGVSLNAAIGELLPLVERLEPVMRNLASPDTGLSRFVSALAATAEEAAPVAEIQGRLFVDLETTFRAFADVARPFIQETISKSPETEEVAIETLPRIRPFLANTAVLFGELRPGFHAFAPASREAAQAVSLGTKALRIAPAFNAQLDPTAQSLLDLNNDPVSREGIRDLTAFNNVLSPPLAFITPAQSICNYATVFLQNFASIAAFGDGLGTNQRAVVLQEPTGPNSEVGPSSAPASGEGDDLANALHYNPYPNTAAPGQERECEAGSEVYNAGQVAIGNVPGNQGTQTSGQIQAQTQRGQGK
jgi:virulence factor Mce-like protein